MTTFEELEAYKEALMESDKSILTEAEELINGARRKSYGPVDESAQRLSDAWTAYLKPKLKDGAKLSAEDSMLMMAILKILRESVECKRDNRVDCVGYIILANKVCNTNS